MSGTVRFVILGTQRTGTTLVRTSLSSHPDILCCGEAFSLGAKPYSNPDGYWWYSRQQLKRRVQAVLRPSSVVGGYLDYLYSSTGYSAIGFKLMLNQCVARPYIWSLLLQRDVRAVLVRRVNILRTLVSRCSAKESGVYHVSQTLPVTSAVKDWVPQSVEIRTATLVKDLAAIDAEYSAWQARLRNSVEYIDVGYEDYVADADAGNRKILEFLRVRQQPLESDLKKVNPGPLSDLISNYEQVVMTLRDTRYAQYLEAP